ncbi:branched-chain amino acid transaminase [Pajaroellobacter abortibovis]|uniref:Branched-chain-amino-acid aminotransferase n=1 Tax=Pajaroellobacter abortibovis TaxID=1882918 RepID=A0A1L6MY52_9BACT|nr:branched-chain amino acid transaminase [Pajaroellobacter abortibovis]APS00501.1 branched chain amino acid aminotransferase [Pajaroellobacter abortibovis]
MIEKEKKIWMDGEWIDWEQAQVHVLIHSLHYGLGVFEGIRAYRHPDDRPVIFRLEEHLTRLFDSCRLISMDLKWTNEELTEACRNIISLNEMKEGYIRPLVFAGDHAMGLYAPDNPIRACIIAWKWGPYLGRDSLKAGIHCKISSFARHHVNISLVKAKLTGQYTNSILARKEAKLAGYDEAILLDSQGYLAEGTGENLFLIKKGVLYTPDASCSILDGITRNTILTLAREEGIPTVETRLTRDQLYLADEAFLTGTAAELIPIREVDNRLIGERQAGPITRHLQQRYFNIVTGHDQTHPEWYTYV